jgi:ABC-type nitrate/sulfonate/bicarbonate transport system substrate-binding protein
LGLLLGIAGVLLMAVTAMAGDAQNEELPTVKLVYWRSIDDLPFYVGVEKGYFKEAGVNVELEYIKGEQNVLAAVLRDDVACGIVSLASLCKLVEKNVPITVVSWMGHAHKGTKCGIHVGKQTKYETLQDIKGLRVGTGGSINSKTLLTQAAAKGGYELKDIRPLWGATPDNPMQYEAALRSGGLDAFVV